jgi:hypothetical protein
MEQKANVVTVFGMLAREYILDDNIGVLFKIHNCSLNYNYKARRFDPEIKTTTTEPQSSPCRTKSFNSSTEQQPSSPQTTSSSQDPQRTIFSKTAVSNDAFWTQLLNPFYIILVKGKGNVVFSLLYFIYIFHFITKVLLIFIFIPYIPYIALSHVSIYYICIRHLLYGTGIFIFLCFTLNFNNCALSLLCWIRGQIPFPHKGGRNVITLSHA